MSRNTKKKMSEVEFTFKLIDALRKPYVNDKGETVEPKGIHTVYSKANGANFNQMWKAYFDTDPIAGINKLKEDGHIEMHPARGGVMIYKPGEMPKGSSTGDGKKGLEAVGIL